MTSLSPASGAGNSGTSKLHPVCYPSKLCRLSELMDLVSASISRTMVMSASLTGADKSTARPLSASPPFIELISVRRPRSKLRGMEDLSFWNVSPTTHNDVPGYQV